VAGVKAKKMPNNFMHGLRENIIANGFADDETLEGCTPAEILSIETQLGIALPDVYRTFLKEMGKCTGDFLSGIDVTYPAILSFKETAQRLLRYANASPLSSTAFVFALHQDYQFMFFDTTKGDDPPIFHYREKDVKSRQLYDSYSNWLRASLDDQIAIAVRLGAR
jgi:hypothetical protein